LAEPVMAEAAAAEQFGLDVWQRKCLLLREVD
jgi:hypothetical protein